MPLQRPSQSETPAKRMRLGTKSCAECRRRKVRCIFTANNSACQECILHEASCTTQQPKRSDTPQNEHHERLQQKVDQLEGIIRRVCKAIAPDFESLDLSQVETQATETIANLRSETIPQRDGYIYSSRATTQAESVNRSSTGSLDTRPAKADLSEVDAPLLQLFEQAMTVQWDNLQVRPDRAVLTENLGATSRVAALKYLIPNHNDLTLILELTEHLWPIWPSLPIIHGGSSIHGLRPVAVARNFIFQSMETSMPAAAAKGILWLALCVQQLPRGFERQCPKLPAPPNNLITSYLSGAESLLTLDEELGGSIEGLEAISLKLKIYINMGKPRKAWASARHGIDQALLLGLHHLEDSTDRRKKTIWSFLWQFDRQLSLILGFPCAISESHPSLSVDHTDGSTTALVVHKLSVISGHIAERNHNYHNVDYLATLKIAQELDKCRKEMPEQWWEIPTPNMPFKALYGQQTIKITYYQLQKYLHLPYMLKHTPECDFIDSRTSALKASREMVKAYQTLRSHRNPMVIMCDLMDFQIFSAIIVIIINLLSQPSSDSLLEQTCDWELVSYTTTTLKHISEVMDCSVAKQAAQLLQYLVQAHNGLYAGPPSYEAVIPYFGKVRISRPRNPAVSMSMKADSSSLTETPPGTAQTTPSLPNLAYDLPPEVQFCTDPFMSVTASPAECVYSNAELNADWTAISDGYTDYEFNQVFDIMGPPGV